MVPDLGRWLTVVTGMALELTGATADRRRRVQHRHRGADRPQPGPAGRGHPELPGGVPGLRHSDVTVVVDATFGHRIDPSELPAFEQAVDHGEMITPPAGAVGRGDGFILRIAEKSGALVLSNDSFQEFHAERPWLFEPGRLIGGKPVPGCRAGSSLRGPRSAGAKSRAVTTRSKARRRPTGRFEDWPDRTP